MVTKKTLIFFVALLLFMPENCHCKFEKIEQHLKKYEISSNTELTKKVRMKFPTVENAERSIEIKGFGKSFILDLFIYFHHEDANIEYISRESNSTGKYQDLKALLYQGHVRGASESFALGFFTRDNLFRGYFMTDDVYCLEPHEDKKSVIIYKLSDVIFPGCSKTDKGDGVDCSKTKYFEPWKPSKPKSKVKFDYRASYDQYLQRLSDPRNQKSKTSTHMEKDIGYSKGKSTASGYAEDDHKTGVKKNSSTAHTNESDSRGKNHHNDTGHKDGNKSNHHHNDDKNENDKKKNTTIIKTNHQNDTVHTEENSSEKYGQDKYGEELERWLSVNKRNRSGIKNKIDHTHENNGGINNTDHTHENNTGGVNKTHSDVDRDHDDEDDDDDDDDDDRIRLSKYAMEVPFESAQNSIESFKEIEQSGPVSKESHIKTKKNRNFDGNKEIKDFNSINNVELSANLSVPDEKFSTKLSEPDASAGLNSILYNTGNHENNLGNSVNDISILKTEKEDKNSASLSPKKKTVQKRQFLDYMADYMNIPYASIERIDIEPAQMECNLEILISPAFRKKFHNRDDDAIKDIFTHITLVNKLFQKVVFKRKDLPFHAIFRISELVVYKDKAYSPFEMKGEIEDVVKYFNLQMRSCLTIGLMNKILRSPLQFVDGYLPKDGGGACSRIGNFFVVSHGDEVSPAPMGLYLAALIKGFTRGFGATDESEKCRKGDIPNPMLELKNNLLAKQITPGRKYSTFTECNLQDIEKGLKDRKCLIEIKDPVCGNAIIDGGEECDCGPGYMCQTLDHCCKPHLTKEEKLLAWLADGSVPDSCKLVSEAQCAMSQPCCNNCFVRPSLEKLCYYGPGLCDQAYCDGKQANCPSSSNASDGLVCDEFHFKKLEPILCKNKQCDFGLCSGFGLTPCICAPDTGKECISCCQKDGKCKAAVSELHLIEGEDIPLLNTANCTGGLCFRGRCVLEAGLQATNSSGKNLASVIRSTKVLTALNLIFITIITFSILFFLL